MTASAEIVLGILGSIVYDGLKRPVKGIADAFTRKKAINRALTGTPEPARNELRPELIDLVKVLGNDHNAYDDKVAEFLIEIERSAIPDALKHFSMCGKDPNGAFPAFDLLYKSYAPLPFSSRALFNALNAAIRMRLCQSVEEKVLYEAIKANTGEIVERLDALSACMENTRSLKPLPAAQFAELRIKIAKGIEVFNRQMNVETTQGTKKVPISRLVIAPRLSAVSQQDTLAAHRDARQDRNLSMTYISFRRSFSRAIILGDPGGGKSTLTQLLCYDLARQIGLQATAPRHLSFDSREQMLPLRIVLRTLEKKQHKNPSYSIFDYLVDDVKIYCDNDDVIAEQFLKQTLSLGKAVLLFDGLDEVLEVEARRAAAALIEKFGHAYATCPIIVTSRIVGYKDAPLSDDFSMHTLSRLNKEEVRKFCSQMIRAVSGVKKAEAESKAMTFLTQTETTAADLRENPLLLGLMVYIFNVRGDVPNNRPEIYKECSLLMFEKWDQRRDIIFSFPQDFNLLDLFGYIASNIFGNADTEDGVTEDWLVDKLRSFFFIWYDENKPRSYEAAKILVSFITGRAWVMCDVGPHLFKFTHRTFLEYFFARRLEEESGGTVPLLQNHLFAKVIKAEWDVVSHLALQISTFRSGVKSTHALDTILQYAKGHRLSPDEEANFLTFVAKALEYLIVPEPKLREIVDHLFDRCIHIGATVNLRSIEIVHDLLKSTQKKGPYVETRLRERIHPLLSGPSSTARSFALYLIGARYTGFATGTMGGLVSPSDRVWRTFAESRAKIERDQLSRAFKDVEEARVYIYIFHNNSLELYRQHRASLFKVRPSPLVPSDIGSLAFLLFLSTLRGPLKRRLYLDAPVDLNDKQAKELLDLICEDLYVAWRAGHIGELLGDTQYFAVELFEEVIFRWRQAEHETRRASKPHAASREIFVMLLFMSSSRSSEELARRVPRSLREQQKDALERLVREEWAFEAGDKYGRAVVEVVESLRSEMNPAQQSSQRKRPKLAKNVE